jgi:hypothetical protein
MSGLHGVPEKRATDIAKLQKRRENHDREQRLKERFSLCNRGCGEEYRTNKSDRQQNDKSEPDS